MIEVANSVSLLCIYRLVVQGVRIYFWYKPSQHYGLWLFGPSTQLLLYIPIVQDLCKQHGQITSSLYLIGMKPLGVAENDKIKRLSLFASTVGLDDELLTWLSSTTVLEFSFY